MAPPTAWRPPSCGSWGRRSSPSAWRRTASTSTGVGSTAPAELAGLVRERRRRSRHRARRRRGPAGAGRRGRDHHRRRPDPGADRRLLARRRAGCAAARVVATVMSNLGLERYLKGRGLGAAAHRGRRPLRRRADARDRLQPGRRAVRPHHHAGLQHHRRRADRRAAGAGRAGRGTPAGQRGLPPLRAAAAAAAERALHRRIAARSTRRCSGDRRCRRHGSATRPPADPQAAPSR